MKKGKFIAIYGINNIGKTTHARLVTEKLCGEGFHAIYLKYPLYDIEPTGPYLNRILRQSGGGRQSISEEELQMWFALNRYQYQPQLFKMLDDGKIVIAEDYTSTGIAWGSAKGADTYWLEALNAHLLKEDFSLLLEGERTMKAREDFHIHESDDALMEVARKEFDLLAAKHNWTRIAMQPTKEASFERIYSAVKNFLTS